MMKLFVHQAILNIESNARIETVFYILKSKKQKR